MASPAQFLVTPKGKGPRFRTPSTTALDQLNRDREQQRKHDEASRKRIEERRVSERLELARKEKASVDDRRDEPSLEDDAAVARNWGLWHSEQEARRLNLHLQKQNIERDRAGIGAGIRGEVRGGAE
ncbi:hypothetical protein DL95DRAFT_414946 [Leptodontidium sp. 2 PMI_412]|nr:hypothetical protein DL95DRAFT_414946 [Leptodontidium sp. 2 PMI_412]